MNLHKICHNGSYKWVSMSLSQLPHGLPAGTLRAGTDIDNTPIYVGRACHKGDILPAKVIPAKKSCYVAYGGLEIPKENFEVMVPLMMVWKPACNGCVPPGAVGAGVTVCGEILYMGRVPHDGAVTLGKIHPSHGTCYYPFDGIERSSVEYQCLVLE